MQSTGPLVRVFEHWIVLFELATCLGNEACWIEGAADAEARGLPEDLFANPDRTAVVPPGGRVMSSWANLGCELDD